MKVVGVFAGIGGLEEGLSRAGHEAVQLCEIDDAARAVLGYRFGLSQDDIVRDVRDLGISASVDLVAAGFPCQDLSQAGRLAGIAGKRSSIVDELLQKISWQSPDWVLIENVPFMLHLDRGRAMWHLVGALELLGYRWAYRTIDTRAFGLPQRRRRVFLLASRAEDPTPYLLSNSTEVPTTPDWRGSACGFYWTEGNRGLGWVVDGVPTLKGGSGLGIPSPPAVWMPDGRIVTPSIVDAERLQGFDDDWTKPAVEVRSGRYRWKLVGNAVSVPVAEWIGKSLSVGDGTNIPRGTELDSDDRWPYAGFGYGERRFMADATDFPIISPAEPLHEFLSPNAPLLSERATRGFLSRLTRSSLKYPSEFEQALRTHLQIVA